MTTGQHFQVNQIPPERLCEVLRMVVGETYSDWPLDIEFPDGAAYQAIYQAGPYADEDGGCNLGVLEYLVSRAEQIAGKQAPGLNAEECHLVHLFVVECYLHVRHYAEAHGAVERWWEMMFDEHYEPEEVSEIVQHIISICGPQFEIPPYVAGPDQIDGLSGLNQPSQLPRPLPNVRPLFPSSDPLFVAPEGTRTLVRGQRVCLDELIQQSSFKLSITMLNGDMEFDAACFGLNAEDRLQDDRYMVFYNQPAAPDNSILILHSQGGHTMFAIDLVRLPAMIQKLAFTINIDGAGVMSQAYGLLRLWRGNDEVARYVLDPADYDQEKSVIAVQLYFRGVWRVNAVGQGFSGGLRTLLQHFGGVEV